MYAWIPRILLVCLVPIYGIYLLAPAVGYMHDDGVYMVTARALARGHGYLIESLPSELPQTKYPILYPAVISIFWRWIPDTTAAVLATKVFSLACGICWLWMVYVFLRHTVAGRATAEWILFFTAASPWVLVLCTSALPDALFACCSTAAILLLARSEWRQEPLSLKLIAAVAALAAASFLLRSAGIALLAAGILILVRRRNWRQALLFVAICALLCLPWLLWQGSQAAPTDPVQLYYSKSSYARGHIFAGYSLAQMLSIVLMNASMLATSYGLSLQSASVLLSLAIGGILLLITVLGWLREAKARDWDAVSIWVLLYTGLLLCWAWPPYRYATLVLPMFLAYLANQLRRWDWSETKLQLWSGRTALALCAVLAVATTISGARVTLETGSLPDWPDRWTESKELADWIHHHTPVNAVVSGNLDPTLYLLSERKAIRVFRHAPYELFYGIGNGEHASGTAEDVKLHFRNNHIQYVVLTPMNGYREGQSFLRVFEQLRNSRPDAIRLMKQLPTPGYAIYQVDSESL